MRTQNVREVEVLQAARHESSNAFLVYASEQAMAVENKELPLPLKVGKISLLLLTSLTSPGSLLFKPTTVPSPPNSLPPHLRHLTNQQTPFALLLEKQDHLETRQASIFRPAMTVTRRFPLRRETGLMTNIFPLL